MMGRKSDLSGRPTPHKDDTVEPCDWSTLDFNRLNSQFLDASEATDKDLSEKG